MIPPHLLAATLTCLFVLGAEPLRAAAEGPKLVVVVARGSKIKALSRAQLRRVFLAEPVSVQDIPLVPFNSPAGDAARVAFDRAVLGMSEAEVGRFWVDRKVRGQPGAPRTLPSQAHVLKVVAKFPGAVSYLPADKLSSAVQPVEIDGLAYTDEKYPLRAP
jgi:hypothetical protein